jgi:hypothetical protein
MTRACYQCAHRRSVPGDAHSACAAADHLTLREQALPEQRPEFTAHAIKMGWAMWPRNFDPAWLEKCQYFTEKEKT